MLSKFITRDHNPRLLLIYAGWGMDWRPFRDLRKNGYDIMVIWDYTSLNFNWQTILEAYSEVCLLAWSMGVFAASLTIHQLLPRITKRIAVNGTLEPVHDRLGIPAAIFGGTLNGLSPSNVRKFYRRMCISAEQFAMFMDNRPQRTLESLIDELRAIETHSILHTPQVTEWDLAVISRHDAIFSAANQLNAWRATTPVQLMDAAHLPDFAMLVSRLFIDKKLVGERFGSAAATYGDNAGAQHIAARRLLRHAADCGISSLEGSVLEVGCGQGTLTALYVPLLAPHTRLTLWDIAPVSTDALPPQALFECCDAETAIRRLPEASRSAILSANTIQWFNSPASFIRECARVLTPGGILVISTFVSGNLPELTRILGNGLQLPTAEAWQSMTAAHLEVLQCADDSITVSFDSPRSLLAHLSDTGVNAVDYGRSPVTLARRILDNVSAQDGKYTLTFKPVYIIARKPLD